MTDAREARGRAAARTAGHVLVDMLVATAGADELDEEGIAAVQLARQRIYEIGAIRVTPDPVDPDSGYLVDATPLLNAALNLLHWLAATLADKADADYDDVLLDLRQQLADWERGVGQGA